MSGRVFLMAEKNTDVLETALAETWKTDLFSEKSHNPVLRNIGGMVQDMYSLSSVKIPLGVFSDNLSSFIFHKYSLDPVPQIASKARYDIRHSVVDVKKSSSREFKHRYMATFQFESIGNTDYFAYFEDKKSNRKIISSSRVFVSEKCAVVFLSFYSKSDNHKTRKEISHAIENFLGWRDSLSDYIKTWNISLLNAVRDCFKHAEVEENEDR